MTAIDDLGGFLVYHPPRTVVELPCGTIVHCDSFAGNQDPYVWNDEFLHTFCHITQIGPRVGHVNFWVTGDQWPNFNSLWCDLIFSINTVNKWKFANSIDIDDILVDSPTAFEEHYRHHQQHPFRRRCRVTLKANARESFQPQIGAHLLIDIIPFLETIGLSCSTLREAMVSTPGSRPYRLDKRICQLLNNHIAANAQVKLRGCDLVRSRPNLADRKCRTLGPYRQWLETLPDSGNPSC